MTAALANQHQIFARIPNRVEDSTAPWTDLVCENFHVAVYRNAYPVTLGHLLFVPKYSNVGVLASAFDSSSRRQCRGSNWRGTQRNTRKRQI